MPSVCTIINPAAANGRAARLWPKIHAQLAAHGLDGRALFTPAPGMAGGLASRALHEGHDTIIAVGGDGTINEVVNGFFEAGQPINSAARLGIVCCGTGADFVKSIGLPTGSAAVPHLVAGRTVPIDLGLATFRDLSGRPTSRYFLNFADLGMGGATVARVDRTSKALGGFTSFLWGAICTILTYRCQPAELIIDDGESISGTVGDVVVANGRYFGGGMHVAPDAVLADGLLDVLVLGQVPKLELLFHLLPRVYRGTHVGHPKVLWRRARHVVVRSPRRLLLDIDGELAGTSDAEFRVLPGALPMIVP